MHCSQQLIKLVTRVGVFLLKQDFWVEPARHCWCIPLDFIVGLIAFSIRNLAMWGTVPGTIFPVHVCYPNAAVLMPSLDLDNPYNHRVSAASGFRPSPCSGLSNYQ